MKESGLNWFPFGRNQLTLIVERHKEKNTL